MPKSHEILINRHKPLAENPGVGHNRWHPRIPPILTIDPGDTVRMEVRDGADGLVTEKTTHADVSRITLDRIHPLTGPIFVHDAEPGDLLEINILEVETQVFGFTTITPGFGLLRRYFSEPFLVRWQIDRGANAAISTDIPGIHIPGAPFMGVMGVAPSLSQLAAIQLRERNLLDRGGIVLPPSRREAVPSYEPIASEGLRTIPPREVGGNMDIKQLTAGATLLLPVSERGALFSVGDGHFAQGDGESCGTAIETGTTLTVRLELRKGEAHRRSMSMPEYIVSENTSQTRSQRYHVTTGIPVSEGRNEFEDVTLAARNAVLNMIGYLVAEYSFTREQAYAIVSVAGDLRISEVVDVPNVIVSVFMPLNIFD
jgi:formamidase